MRLLHLADLHLHLSGPRSAECRRILDHVAEHAGDVRPDAIVIAGDVFDRRSTPEERLYLASFLSALGDVAPVEIIHGNHDSVEDIELFGRLDDDAIHVWARPIVAQVGGCSLAVLPWPNLGHLASAMGPQASIADRRTGARTALLDLLRGLRADLGLRPGVPSILVGHLPVIGASMDSGQPVAGGNEIALSVDELLECGAAGVALGHVHLRQQMRSSDGRPVWYAGAPFRGSFGEATGGKGGLVWEWEGDHWRVEPWAVPARRMILIDMEWTDVGDGEGGPPVGLTYDSGEDSDNAIDLGDAEVRLRFAFPSDVREAARIQAAEMCTAYLSAGAHSVTLDPQPIIVQRTRCAEIATARTTAEKLAAWAQATGVEVPEGAMVKLAQIETEVQP